MLPVSLSVAPVNRVSWHEAINAKARLSFAPHDASYPLLYIMDERRT